MATPKKQREYPRVNNIKDQDTKQTIKLLWDRAHDASEASTNFQDLISQAQATISAQSDAIAALQRQMKQVSAGGGTSQQSTVGGGGSGGSSGGSGSGTPGGGTPPPNPPPTDHPDHTDVVAQAKADLIAGGIGISGDCGAFEIVKLVAWRLTATEPTIGLLSKPSGTNCDGYNVSCIFYQDGVLFDILQDAGGANGPQWNFNGNLDPSLWRAPVAPSI